MQIMLKQKMTEIEGKKIAYVEVELTNGKYTYRVLFDKNTKKRFNAYCRSVGFVIGQTDEDLPETTLEI